MASLNRGKRIFCNVLILHILAVFGPMTLLYVRGLLEPEKQSFSVNLVDVPSVGQVTGNETQRLPPEPKKPAEHAKPESKTEPRPELPDVIPAQPQRQSVAEPVVSGLPVPTPPPVKPVREPQLNLTKLAASKPTTKDRRPSKSADDSRKSSDVREKTARSGSNTNELVPIGKADIAQKFGERSSNTPQGGSGKTDSYAGILVTFLKMQWAAYVPSRAQLGDRKPEVRIALNIAGNGSLISARVVQASGIPAMDAAVTRMLEELNRFPMPPDGKAWSHQNIVIDTSAAE